ncbi:hypothetical protein HF289_10605 [Acidithiobacillus ferrooxidans]|uniref:hypothetical protein n=1 Tax=Acidithiobacillus ferrooxidans TaxID=920 RepID=UPI001C06B7BF|nr:hypothetical protein [Acidithiobacillus ferrooxidans]MBU2857295.1 hypothetical protein [Acidithiobacillus ferrooxidans]
MKIHTTEQIIKGMATAKRAKWWWVHPGDPRTADLAKWRQDELMLLCMTVAHHAGHDTGGFLYALVMMAGLEQDEWKGKDAVRYMQSIAGSPALPPLLLAMDQVERFRQALAREQALEQRAKFRDVKSCKAGEDGLVSRNPNLTKSYMKNPNRLRLVQ